MSKWIMTAAAIITLGILTSAANACCAYGCCDCGCVALQAQKNAAAIAKSIEKNMGKGKSGSVQSFKIDMSEKDAAAAKWTCAPAQNGATCTRQ